MKKKKRKRFDTYKETVAKRFEIKKANEEYECGQELLRISDTATKFGESLDISTADTLNAMGMYRFGIEYEGAYKNE